MENKIDHNKKDIWEALGTNHNKIEQLAEGFHHNINEITSVSEAITTSVKQVRDQVLGEPGIEVTPYEVELVLLGVAIEKVMAGMSRFHSQRQHELPPEVARAIASVFQGKGSGKRIIIMPETNSKKSKKKISSKKKTTVKNTTKKSRSNKKS